MKEYEIDFAGNVKCIIQIINNIPTVIKAMDGWGNAISTEDITIYPKF